MVEGSEGGGPESGPGSKHASSFESSGGRLRFRVELKPGETTIVSWKKLLREANLSNSKRPGPSVSGPSHGSQCEPAPPAPPVGPSSSKEPTENEQKDSQAQAGSNRLSTVIERIERMYAGNGSSDEEDAVLDNMPDDDEYDTEDSFIDDTELDDYFQVDNATIIHDGFFVNRGKLEHTEPTISTNQQPKKRRRKDLTKGNDGSDDGRNPNKIVKIGNKGRKASSSIQENSTSQSHSVAMPSIHGEDMQFQASPANAPEVPLKMKAADIQTTADPSGLFNGDATRQDMATCQQRPGVISSKNHISKLAEIELQDTSTQRSHDKSSHKASLMQRKEGSSVRPKSTALDKAIRELEKIVAEFRPPSTEVPDPDNSSQAVKRRLPPEIKQKLAKVARLAQSIYGKIPKDVVNHLMSIVGHLMQIRTLKRNLSAMANMGLSAKQEKDERIQKIKQEVAEMVKLRIPSMKSKVEKQAANSDDFQEAGAEDKDKSALKRKYSMDDVLENKICDLYDLYVERLEEYSGPPVRRLYEELVVLWPSGFMDTDGIKRAIYRAKDRRGLCRLRKDREKINNKKVSTPKADVSINVSQTLQNREKLLPDSRNDGSILTSKPVPSATLALAAARVANGPMVHKPKQEKMKGSSSKPIDGMPSNELPKKNVKRKRNADLDVDNTEFFFERLPKHHKHVAAPLTKSNLQPPVPSGSELK